MAVVLGDFDNNGNLDLFSTNIGRARSLPHALYENLGDGRYHNVGQGVGVVDWEFG